MSRIWLKPWVAGLGLALAATIVVLNFAAVSFGADLPWLVALDLASDLAVLGAMVVVIVRAALLAETRETRARTAIEESQGRLAAVALEVLARMLAAAIGRVLEPHGRRILVGNCR